MNVGSRGSRRIGRRQPLAAGVRDGIGPAVGADLGVNAADVVLGRAHADHQLCGDFANAEQSGGSAGRYDARRDREPTMLGRRCSCEVPLRGWQARLSVHS
jgi:hypothetical protein